MDADDERRGVSLEPDGTGAGAVSTTILERGMLKTRVPERGMDVTTVLPSAAQSPAIRGRLRARYGGHCWTSVWTAPRVSLLWLRFWPEPHSAGGLAEAHEWVVEQVRRCVLPAPDP